MVDLTEGILTLHKMIENQLKKGKVSFYIAQYPVHRTAQSAFTHYFKINQIPSQLLWETYSHLLQLMCERLHVHISTTVYCQVLTYTAE